MSLSGTILALIRHGQTEWNRQGRLQGSSDVPLNDIGRRQVRASARALATQDWSAVVTSPLIRARQSAAIIAGELSMGTPAVFAGLRERTYGEAEGLTREDAARRWTAGDYPGQEDLTDLGKRGIAALDAVAHHDPGTAIVVVTHGALIRAVLTGLHSEPVPRIANGAVSTVELTAGAWRVHSVNVAHRAGGGPVALSASSTE